MAKLLGVLLLTWTILQGNFLPIPRDICEGNVCIAGKKNLDNGKCECCVHCPTRFYRQQGGVACPSKWQECSENCIPGYENQIRIDGRVLDTCKKSRITTENPQRNESEKSNDKEVDSPDSSTIITATAVPTLLVLGCGVIFVIYKKKCKNYIATKSESTDDNSLKDLSIAEDNGADDINVKPDKQNKEPVEGLDESTLNPERVKKEESQLVRAEPIDANANNINQTFFAENNVSESNELPARFSEIPTAPHNDMSDETYYSSVNDDGYPSTTYSQAPTIPIDELLNQTNSDSSNKPDELITMRLNLDFDLVVNSPQIRV